MPHKGPHISISADFVVNRMLRVNLDEFEEWPKSVRQVAIAIAEELFLVVYNPFIDSQTVRESVSTRFERESPALAHHYVTSIGEGITMFWSSYEAEVRFRMELIERLSMLMPRECIDTRAAALVENSTDATDLRMELPILVVAPATAEQVSAVVRLANEMKFAIIPRGGGSGLTGGAVPARRRTVILSMTRLTAITEINVEQRTMTCEAGVVTSAGIKAAAEQGLLFSVDPASKTASTIGGNVSENSGGPFAFEYGVTIDNLLSWRMVTPTGEIITVERVAHPRHKILPDETAIFEVKDLSGGVRSVVKLAGDEIRLKGLGKDVTNKALGGLPGMQKEGVDGIIVEATFTLYPKPEFSRVLVLEFFGRSMHTAMLVIKDVIAMRDNVREDGDYVKLSALEEFGPKYVQAIEYKTKSTTYEGHPISVLIIQLDGDDEYLLNDSVQEIVEIVHPYDNVDVFVAKDEREAEIFWEDRHRLSAISKRTSGFKINEDVVIPTDAIPDFALFIEQLNVECAAQAYREALQDIGCMRGMPMEDKEFNREFTYASKASGGEVSASEVSDVELTIRAVVFLGQLAQRYPSLARKIEQRKEYMQAAQIIVASHMHAGDGNWHVNIPVNSNDANMLHNAEQVAARVMRQAQAIGGEVSGEHGIGITKIGFLRKDKMKAIRAFKERVDPRNVLNPAKLTQRELPVRPFTFSFNRLIADIRESGLPDKERLITLLTNVQVCTRCGKCKQVCPMNHPERGLEYYPRNKNMALGALIEAVYYSQVNKGKPDANLLAEVRTMMEHCTACGKCAAVCPVKINSAEVALALRSFVEDEGAGGHPIKSRVLHWLVKSPSKRVPLAAKAASVGQRMQNNMLKIIPYMWQEKFSNPLFSGPGPEVGYANLAEALRLEKGHVFVAREPVSVTAEPNSKQAVLYFVGCGGSLFYRNIGLAGLMLLLESGVNVILPKQSLCCGYPLLAAGADADFKSNMAHNSDTLARLVDEARQAGYDVTHVITACGSCRDGIGRHELATRLGNIEQADLVQFVLPRLPEHTLAQGTEILYHAACHAEWAGVHKVKAAGMYTKALTKATGVKLRTSAGCCGESGMGAMTSPQIYNKLRQRKHDDLKKQFETYDAKAPIIVGCPSCRGGIARSLINMHDKRSVLHTVEWLAALAHGADWSKKFRRAVQASEKAGLVRVVDVPRK
ncbi:MAG: FAD-binding and (Fe-S)-binding domain-containing protein [Pseudomonadota bacterium]